MQTNMQEQCLYFERPIDDQKLNIHSLWSFVFICFVSAFQNAIDNKLKHLPRRQNAVHRATRIPCFRRNHSIYQSLRAIRNSTTGYLVTKCITNVAVNSCKIQYLLRVASNLISSQATPDNPCAKKHGRYRAWNKQDGILKTRLFS